MNLYADWYDKQLKTWEVQTEPGILPHIHVHLRAKTIKLARVLARQLTDAPGKKRRPLIIRKIS